MKYLFVALLLVMSSGAVAHEFLLDDLQIIHPAIPATPMDVTSGNIYMALANDTDEPERLLGIETAFGPAVLERQVTAPDGSVRTEKMAWIDIPPGDVVLLIQGEMRGRVEGINRPLFEGAEVEGALIFEKRGRFEMFFLVDPLEEIVETGPVATTEEIDRAAAILEISEALRAELGADTMIGPIALSGDVALAGWTRGEDGARAFLRRRNDVWTPIMWADATIFAQPTMTSLGVPARVADTLRKEFVAGENALGAGFSARFDAFPGTVLID